MSDYGKEIAHILASGGYVSHGRGGYTAHYENIGARWKDPESGRTGTQFSSLSGCGPELWDQAVGAGVPCHDTTTIPDDRIYDVVGFPIPEPSTFDRLEHRASDPDWSDALSMSYCDARLYAVLAWTLGATLAGQPLPSEEEQRKAAAWFAARDVRRAEYERERAQAHLDAADTIVTAEVKRLACAIMRALPEIERFVCGMGSALFFASYRRHYDDGSVSDEPEVDQWSVCGLWTGWCSPPPELQPLIDLFDTFDPVLHMSGDPITILNKAHKPG